MSSTPPAKTSKLKPLSPRRSNATSASTTSPRSHKYATVWPNSRAQRRDSVCHNRVPLTSSPWQSDETSVARPSPTRRPPTSSPSDHRHLEVDCDFGRDSNSTRWRSQEGVHNAPPLLERPGRRGLSRSQLRGRAKLLAGFLAAPRALAAKR